MTVLDARFAAFTLPSASDRADPWTPGCVMSILCPWSPHTIDLLHTKITLKSFDDIWWDDEEWDGSAWVPKRFPGGGYNTGTEIGVFNSSCEEMAKTLYHEVLHADQPTSHRTTLKRESYAYRIEEEFTIAAGLSGRPSVRSTDARGREFADRTKVEAFVRADADLPGGARQRRRRGDHRQGGDTWATWRSSAPTGRSTPVPRRSVRSSPDRSTPPTR